MSSGQGLQKPSPQEPQSSGQLLQVSAAACAPAPSHRQSPQWIAQSSGQRSAPPSAPSQVPLPHQPRRQSAGQEKGFSPRSQAPLPHAGPQSSGQLAGPSPHPSPWQVPSPQLPQQSSGQSAGPSPQGVQAPSPQEWQSQGQLPGSSPPSGAQTPSPQEHSAPRPSSLSPSQSSSAALHLSSAGSRALHADQPARPLQTCSPSQVPHSLARLHPALRPSVAAAQQPSPSEGEQTTRSSSPPSNRRGAHPKPRAHVPAVEPQSSRQSPGTSSPSPCFATHTDKAPHSSVELQPAHTAAGRGTHKKMASGPSPETGVQVQPLGQCSKQEKVQTLTSSPGTAVHQPPGQSSCPRQGSPTCHEGPSSTAGAPSSPVSGVRPLSVTGIAPGSDRSVAGAPMSGPPSRPRSAALGPPAGPAVHAPTDDSAKTRTIVLFRNGTSNNSPMLPTSWQEWIAIWCLAVRLPGTFPFHRVSIWSGSYCLRTNFMMMMSVSSLTSPKEAVTSP